MRWWKHLFEKVIDDETLSEAFDAVVKSRKERDRKHPGEKSFVDRYATHKGTIIHELKQELADKSYHLSIRPSFDRMERGKMRHITPPSFRDSVVYHAVISVLKPYLMGRLYYYSLGSIPGKGPRVGLNSMQGKLKDHRKDTKYCLQIDVTKFYDSIDRQMLMEKLGRKIKDSDMLWLLSIIIHEQPGERGLPLGAYTSGWLGNFYLDDLDHAIKQSFDTRYCYRYVDDVVILGPNKKKLHRIRKNIDELLASKGLRMKGNWQVYPVDSRKIDFLGFRTGRDVRIDRKRNMVSYARFAKRHGMNPTPSHAASIESRRGRCRKFNSFTFLRTRIEPYTDRAKNRRILRYEARWTNEGARRAC